MLMLHICWHWRSLKPEWKTYSNMRVSVLPPLISEEAAPTIVPGGGGKNLVQPTNQVLSEGETRESLFGIVLIVA